MIARIPLLTGLLIAQLVILGVLMLTGEDEGAVAEMLSFDPVEVTALTIEDGDGNVVSLQSIDGKWRLGELPADGNKVDDAIASLAGGSASWPVATSESSQARFEVTDGTFQRRVAFGSASGELATLYLGSSPGFRRIHAREASSEAIFSIDFGVHELPTDASDWLDAELLQTEAISSLTFPGGEVLSRAEDDVWTIDGQPADAEAAERYVDRIEKLSVLGLHELDANTTLGEPVTVRLEDDQGTHALTFALNEAVDEYVLESDRVPGAFRVASYIVEQILVPATELLPAAEEGEVGVEEAEPETGDG
ncbi:MAG: DUF4340 domain-containing protein [Gammaproteobacteria bacterium]|jgi:hypothetical protein|nr:MAG: DUF4340 domain-containing protein [Gammaproteobacteria bacterium]